MNLFDIAIVVILGYCLIRGIFRGFIKEAAAIVAILAGFYAAYMFHGEVSPHLSQWIADPDYRLLAAFALVFFGVFFFITLVGVLIRMLARAAALGVVDRFFGAVFGGAKAVLLVTLIYIVLVTFTPAGGMTFIKDSKLAPPVVATGQAIVDLMPDGMTQAYDRKIKEFKKGWGRK